MLPFHCDICHIGFKRAHHFKKHQRTLAHLDKLKNREMESGMEVQERYSCQICFKSNSVVTFKSSYHFDKHLKSRGHLEKVLQLSQSGEDIPDHLVLKDEALKPVEGPDV